MSETYNENAVELDEKKLRRMLNKIYQLERQNSKTGKYTDKKMKEQIEKIIEEEAKKCF
jgi:ribosomal protein S3AE